MLLEDPERICDECRKHSSNLPVAENERPDWLATQCVDKHIK